MYVVVHMRKEKRETEEAGRKGKGLSHHGARRLAAGTAVQPFNRIPRCCASASPPSNPRPPYPRYTSCANIRPADPMEAAPIATQSYATVSCSLPPRMCICA